MGCEISIGSATSAIIAGHTTPEQALEDIRSGNPSAWPDLVSMLSAGNDWNVATRAGIQRILQILYVHGVVEDERDETGQISRLRFRAQPVLLMLRRMPDRCAQTGLAKSVTEKNNN